MKAYLEIITGGNVRRQECLDQMTIGRDPACTVCLADDQVSRNHAIIRRLAGGNFYLMDLGSRNGCFVNERRVSSPRALQDGDLLTIGRSQLRFAVASEPQSGGAGDDDPSKWKTTELSRTLLSGSAEIQEVTVLVADIRGYTSLSASMDIQLLPHVMTLWFAEVERVIGSCEGEVDKFLGDAVLAIWRADKDPARSVRQAMRAACRIQEVTGRIFVAEAGMREPPGLGAGINSGFAAVGVGQEDTTLGDTVNLAFRLENASRSLNADLVISRDAYRHLPAGRLLGEEAEIVVRGRSIPSEVRALSFIQVRSLLAALEH